MSVALIVGSVVYLVVGKAIRIIRRPGAEEWAEEVALHARRHAEDWFAILLAAGRLGPGMPLDPPLTLLTLRSHWEICAFSVHFAALLAEREGLHSEIICSLLDGKAEDPLEGIELRPLIEGDRERLARFREERLPAVRERYIRKFGG